MERLGMVCWGLWRVWCSFIFENMLQSQVAMVVGVLAFGEKFVVANGGSGVDMQARSGSSGVERG